MMPLMDGGMASETVARTVVILEPVGFAQGVPQAYSVTGTSVPRSLMPESMTLCLNLESDQEWSPTHQEEPP